jgi:Resolvase, N terminal domain
MWAGILACSRHFWRLLHPTKEASTEHELRLRPRLDGRPEPALQLAALKKAGCQTVFKDEGLSGATSERPALLRCLKKLEHGDTLIVWKLDRLGRSLRDLTTMVDDLRAVGLKFHSLVVGHGFRLAARLLPGVLRFISQQALTGDARSLRFRARAAVFSKKRPTPARNWQKGRGPQTTAWTRRSADTPASTK